MSNFEESEIAGESDEKNLSSEIRGLENHTSEWRGGPGWAAIKKEFLRPRILSAPISNQSSIENTATLPSSSSSLSSSTTSTVTVSSNNVTHHSLSYNLTTHVDKDDTRKKSRKENRGQNKNRTSDDIGFNSGGGNQLCRWVMLGQSEKCRFGASKCRDRHDMAEFLANKEADLGPKCHVFDTYGICPAVLNCRFGKGHIDPISGETVISQLPIERRPVKQQISTTMNLLPYAIGGQLQRGKFEYKFAPSLPSFKHKQTQPSITKSSTTITSSSTSTGPTLMWSKKGGISIETPIISDTATLAQTAPREHRFIDFKDKVYVAPLTTVGNLPFRRVMKTLGADITIGEMAMAENIIAGQSSEWALLRRHESEDVFGIQLAGCHVDTMTRAAELIASSCSVDFVDINCGCPLDMVCNRGMGASMMSKHGRLRDLVVTMSRILPCPVTVKMRTGIEKDKDLRFAHKLIGKMRIWSACGDTFSEIVKRNPQAIPLPHYELNSNSENRFNTFPVAAVTIHGRTRQQRYSQTADWSYISSCVEAANAETVLCPPLGQLTSDGYDLSNPHVVKAWGVEPNEITSAKEEEDKAGITNSGLATSTNIGKLLIRPRSIPVIGNGDVMSYAEWREHIDKTGVATCLLARGVLIKPWLCTEIKEKRENWDISSNERLEILRKFANYGLEHWGSDQNGINHTRRFLLEWLAFLYRYIPVGLLEREQRIGEKCPPPVIARNELEQLMLSQDASDWVKISELLLGPVPKDYRFVPKHKSSQAYEGTDDKLGDGEGGGGHGQHGQSQVGTKRDRVEEQEEQEEEEEGYDAQG